jgi:hypothetical protein
MEKLIIQISRARVKGIPIVSGFLAAAPVVDVWRFHRFFLFIPSRSVVIPAHWLYCSAAVGIPSAPVTEAARIFCIFFPPQRALEWIDEITWPLERSSKDLIS